jgi:uncharacterized membrane protein YeaQ/YmgE (transglycosylase-associated protein family)
MGIIIVILLGALVGYIASRLLHRNEGFIGSTIIGVVGAFVGGVISKLTTGANQSFLNLDLSNLLWALGGSLVVVFLLNHFNGRNRNTPVV